MGKNKQSLGSKSINGTKKSTVFDYYCPFSFEKGLSILDSVHTSGQLSEQKCARNMCMVYNIENFLANSMVYLFLSYVHCGPSYLA